MGRSVMAFPFNLVVTDSEFSFEPPIGGKTKRVTYLRHILDAACGRTVEAEEIYRVISARGADIGKQIHDQVVVARGSFSVEELAAYFA